VYIILPDAPLRCCILGLQAFHGKRADRLEHAESRAAVQPFCLLYEAVVDERLQMGDQGLSEWRLIMIGLP